MANKPYIREERLRDLATLLLWDGQLLRRTVKSVFGVKDMQASRLIAAFRAAHPDWVVWDNKAKAFLVAEAKALPKVAGSLVDYLRLATRGDGESWLVDARQDLTHIEPRILADVRAAIRSGTGLEILYRSMTRPQGVTRTIFPHVVVKTARRCHIRAWDNDRRDYRDFNLGRIASASPAPAKAPRMADKDWARTIAISLVPHRGLTVAQQRVVRDELFRGAAALKLEARAALAAYVIQDVQAAIRPSEQLPPDFQLEVSNAAELRDVLMADAERL